MSPFARRSGLYRDARGATAVEFAIVFPVFLLFVLGLIQCGLALWTKFALQHAAEEAARCATVDSNHCGTPSDIQKFATTQAYGLNPAPSTFTVSAQPCGNKVNADYNFKFLTTYFGAPSLTLSGVSCFPK